MTPSARYVAAAFALVTWLELWALAPVALALEPGDDGARYDLTLVRAEGQLEQVEVQLEVGGQVSLRDDGAVRKFPTKVAAEFQFSQRLLGYVDGQTASAIRHYDKAEVTIQVDSGATQPKLRDNRRLVVVELDAGQLEMCSPQGLLTRDELDLIDVLGDSLVLGGLVPDREVALGESWSVPDDCLKALLGVEAIAQSDVTGMISDARDDMVKVMLAGRVDGAVTGVATEIELKAAYLFDLAGKRIRKFEMAVTEKRAISHVGPGLDVAARVRVEMTPIAAASVLSDEVVRGMNLSPGVERRLYQESPLKEFAYSYAPDWYITSESPEMIIMRLVRRGDLVAQVNLTPLVEQPADKLTSMEEFQKDIRFVLGEKFGQFVGVGAWNDSHGQRIFKVVAVGHVEDLPIEWRYYLIVNRQGRRVTVAFTVEAPLVDQLGDADRRIVDSLRIATPEAPATETARTPTPAPR